MDPSPPQSIPCLPSSSYSMPSRHPSAPPWPRHTSLDFFFDGFPSSVAHISPADELFFKGQLLPLQPDPKLNLIQALSCHGHGSDEDTEPSALCAKSGVKFNSCRMQGSTTDVAQQCSIAELISRSCSFRSTHSSSFWESCAERDTSSSSAGRDSIGSKSSQDSFNTNRDALQQPQIKADVQMKSRSSMPWRSLFAGLRRSEIFVCRDVAMVKTSCNSPRHEHFAEKEQHATAAGKSTAKEWARCRQQSRDNGGGSEKNSASEKKSDGEGGWEKESRKEKKSCDDEEGDVEKGGEGNRKQNGKGRRKERSLKVMMKMGLMGECRGKMSRCDVAMEMGITAVSASASASASLPWQQQRQRQSNPLLLQRSSSGSHSQCSCYCCNHHHRRHRARPPSQQQQQSSGVLPAPPAQPTPALFKRRRFRSHSHSQCCRNHVVAHPTTAMIAAASPCSGHGKSRRASSVFSKMSSRSGSKHGRGDGGGKAQSMSSLQEIQSAVQSAIAHCKESNSAMLI